MKNAKQKKTAGRKAKIMVIEDQADQWVIIENAIRQSFQAVEAVWIPNATHALSYLKEGLLMGDRLPDLILLDLYLPEPTQGW
jgi:CheY-like chemotaxis protein